MINSKRGLWIINQKGGPERRNGGNIMNDYTLGAVESKFADIIWSNAPIKSGDIVKICEQKLNWKKPTTYTVLRKLCEKGFFVNESGTVKVVITREEYYADQSGRFVAESFKGSLPAFIAAFISNKTLSSEEADEIQRMIDEYRKGV